MRTNDFRLSGAAIILGCLAVIITMVFHPVGGDFQHLLRIARVVVVTHSLAIAGLALTVIGFRGLSQRLHADAFFADAAFSVFALGTVAGICAAVLNGLATPAFVQHYADSDAATRDAIRPVMVYAHTLNAAFARVLMAAIAVAVLLWSVAMLRTDALPRWSALVGLVAASAALVMVLLGVAGVDVHRFGLFVFGYSAWAIMIGLQLWNQKAADPTHASQ